MRVPFVPPPTNLHQEFVAFKNGLDVVSPPVTVPPGMVRSSQNYEEDINGGYVTVTGYEAFDGQPAPHLALYYLLPIGILGTVTVGTTITGATSGATGVVIAITATDFVITKVTGTWEVEGLTAGSASVAGPATTGATSGKLPAQYRNLAANRYRDDLGAVPGAGNVLGVWYYKNVLYAFRNAVTPGVKMYGSTGAGWVEVPLGIEVTFTGGSGVPPPEGIVIVKGGVTATLKRLVVRSGTFASSDAAGALIFASVSGGPFTAGALTGGMTGTVVAQTAITIDNANGRFKFIDANFTGAADTVRMYGVDGVNRGFEFDGTTFVPISNTGMGALDTPSNVVAHRNYLFYSYYGSVQYSALGNPYNWEVIGGANEIGASDTVTGFAIQPGGELTASMAIYCRSRTYLLYGNDPTTWELINYSETNGAQENSIQLIGKTYVMDDRGVQSLASAQAYGNFTEATISERVKTLLAQKRNLLTDSHVSRDKQQYRLFFSDGTGMYVTLSSKSVSFMPVLFPNPVLVSCSAEATDGSEIIYFGSTDGFVYQMERGTSFNGAAIDAYMYLVFNNLSSYRRLKRYRRLSFEMVGTGYAEFSAGYDLGYSSSEFAQPDLVANVSDTSPPKWGDFKGGEFVWDGSPLTTLSFGITGNGENFALKILSNDNYSAPVKFSGVFLEYSMLRQKR